MIVNKIRKDEFEASNFIATQTSIVCMHPQKVLMVNNLFSDKIEADTPIETRFSYRVLDTEIPEDGLLDVKIGLDIEFDIEEKSNSKKEETPLVRIEIQYVNRYATPKAPIPDEIRESAIPAFSKIHAVLQCWPYFRQLASQLTTEIGLPFILPVIVFKTENDPDNEAMIKENVE